MRFHSSSLGACVGDAVSELRRLFESHTSSNFIPFSRTLRFEAPSFRAKLFPSTGNRPSAAHTNSLHQDRYRPAFAEVEFSVKIESLTITVAFAH